MSIYEPGDVNPENLPRLIVKEDGKDAEVNFPIRFKLTKPLDDEGNQRDQTGDAAEHMRYAHTLQLPTLTMPSTPRIGKAVVVGGAPSIAGFVDKIKELAADPDNAVFALNRSHTWLLNLGIVPYGCPLFEIDAEPDSLFKNAHPDVTYYICSHCHPKTFDELKGHKRVLWHSPPNSPGEKVVADELFEGAVHVGGGVGTMLRTVSLALVLGFRSIELFGCDSCFPDDSPSTHVEGYETVNNVETDSFYIYARKEDGSEVRRFKTVGYLALQVREFEEYCKVNHHMFALRVHGDSLLQFSHKTVYPHLYEKL